MVVSSRDLFDEVGSRTAIDPERVGHLEDEFALGRSEDAVGGKHLDRHRQGELARSLVAETRLHRLEALPPAVLFVLALESGEERLELVSLEPLLCERLNARHQMSPLCRGELP